MYVVNVCLFVLFVFTHGVTRCARLQGHIACAVKEDEADAAVALRRDHQPRAGRGPIAGLRGEDNLAGRGPRVVIQQQVNGQPLVQPCEWRHGRELWGAHRLPLVCRYKGERQADCGQRSGLVLAKQPLQQRRGYLVYAGDALLRLRDVDAARRLILDEVWVTAALATQVGLVVDDDLRLGP